MLSYQLNLKNDCCFFDEDKLFLYIGVQLYGVEHNPLIHVNDNSKPSDDFIFFGQETYSI